MSAEPRILLVEDDPDQAAVERAILERMGCEVAEARGVDEAIGLLAGRHFDLVCLDLMLPRRYGLDLCEFLRARPDAARIPVLVTTSRNLPLDVAQAMDAGASAFLPKPFHLRELAAQVRALLQPVDRFTWRTP